MPNTKPVGVAYEDPLLDAAVIGKSGGTVGFFGSTPVTRPAALTTQLTTITHNNPVTPDYAIQGVTSSTPFGFVTADEGNTVLSVVANLQTRVAQVEARLESLNLIASN